MPRIFVIYEAIDTDFAMQLITDLRDTGVEVITDDNNNKFHDMHLEQELSHCQQLIVVQTPTALLSPRVRTIVDMALNYAEFGQVIEVLRVIAPTFITSDTEDIPPSWEITPKFDARQDYPKALVRLQLKLGLIGENDRANIPPPPAYYRPLTNLYNSNEISNTSLVSNPFYADAPDTLDRPRRSFRYWHVSLHPLLVLSLLIGVLALIAASLTVFALSHPTSNTKSVAISAVSAVVKSTPSPRSTTIATPTPVQQTPTAIATPTPVQQIPAPTPTSPTIVNNPPPPVNPIQDLGNLTSQNYQLYCLSIGDTSVSLDQNNAYGWMCVTPAGNHVTVDTNAACQEQYHSLAATTSILARMVNYSDPNNWHCYSGVRTLGSINFPQYCQSLNEGASLNGKTAYNWYCIVSGNPVVIDTNAACRWQYNESDAIASVQNYFDPNGWVCYGAA